MLEPFEPSFEEDDDEGVTLKDNYPYFGDGTGRSEPITIRNIKIRSESEPVDPDHLREMKSEDAAVRRKTFYHQPRGTLEYTVAGRDTVDSVALQFGCTPSQMMRINHMSSRMIFPGQVIYVPDPMAKEDLCLSPTSPTTTKPAPFSKSMDIPAISQQTKKSDIPTISQAEPKPKFHRRFGLRKSKSVREDKNSSWSRKRKFMLRQGSDPRPGRVVRDESREEEEADTRQFLKVDVKYITDGEGVVSGTMLVTPNAIMFDPNVSDPLVIERGTGPYGVLTQMDMVLGASMYHDISAMNDKLIPNNNKTCPVYVPEKKQGVKTSTPKGNTTNPPLSAEGDILPATDGGITETDSNGNQELSHETILCTSQDSENRTSSGFVNDKSQDNVSVQKDEESLSKPDNITDAEGRSDVGEEKITEESMPFTSGEHFSASSPMTDTENLEIQSEDVELLTAPSLSDSGEEDTRCEDVPQESMDIQESMADDLSKSAMAEDNDSKTDQNISTDQQLDLTSNIDTVDSALSNTGSCLSPSLRDKSTDAEAEKQADKSEDEGVESDLDENDETQPLVSPMAEHEAVLVEELYAQRHLEGYRTLNNEEHIASGLANEEQAPGQADAANDQVKVELSRPVAVALDENRGVELQSPLDSVAMDTNTSSTTDAKDSEPISSDRSQVEHHQASVDNNIERPNHETSKDIQDDSITANPPELTDAEIALNNQIFVDFSSGLFAPNLSGSSLVPDITECVQETGSTQEELKAIQAEGIEIRTKVSGEDVISSTQSSDGQEKEQQATDAEERVKTDAEDGVTKVRSATDATASKELEYNKTNLEEFRPRPAQRYDDPPLYLCLRVSKPMQKTFAKDTTNDSKTTGRTKLPEYWFAIPRDKADKLYDFFLQWSPDIYGKDLEPSDIGFVVVDQEDASLEVVENFFDEPISKDWEIITKEEANRRRMTILECEMNLPLPELKDSSVLLEDIHIHKLSKHLPPRTEGYSWGLLYSTSNNGFSLTSLYRSMRSVDSPVLLVVQDSDNTIFGALVNCGVKISDHYYGTGETFLYKFNMSELQSFKWTGENNFFVKGDKDCLAIGGGDGTFGLWLDGDLYHGRSRSCKTFANEILSQQEDFVIANMEVWGFVLP